MNVRRGAGTRRGRGEGCVLPWVEGEEAEAAEEETAEAVWSRGAVDRRERPFLKSYS